MILSPRTRTRKRFELFTILVQSRGFRRTQTAFLGIPCMDQESEHAFAASSTGALSHLRKSYSNFVHAKFRLFFEHARWIGRSSRSKQIACHICPRHARISLQDGMSPTPIFGECKKTCDLQAMFANHQVVFVVVDP